MRKSVTIFRAATAATLLTGVTLFGSSGPQAMPLAGPSGLKSAIHQQNAIQEVGYVCRRGSYGRRCYYVSSPHRTLRYERPYDPWDQTKYFVGNSHYNVFQWGGAMGNK